MHISYELDVGGAELYSVLRWIGLFSLYAMFVCLRSQIVCVACEFRMCDLCARHTEKSTTNDNNVNNVISNARSFHFTLN